MNHADPQSTGRSKLLGPLFSRSPKELLTTGGSEGGVSVTADSLVVLGRDLNAFTLDDSLRWSFRPGNSYFRTTPLVRSDGVIVTATASGWVFAFNPDGTVNWQTQLSESIWNQASNLGLDGTFFCLGSQGTVFAISRDGRLSWSLNDPNFTGNHRSVLTISPDGRTLYVPGSGVTVNAVDIPSRTVRWRFGTGELWVAPIVDSQGNVYILGADSPAITEPSLISIRPDGAMRWSYTHGNHFDMVFSGDPTIDIHGNIYFALDTLYSVDWQGKLRWKRPLDGVVTRPYCDVPLVCDALGRVYAVVASFSTSDKIAVIFGSDGAPLGQQIVNSAGYVIDSSPAIYSDQVMAIAGYKNDRLYILR